VFRPAHGTQPCYSCLFPQEQQFTDEACSSMGVFAPLVGVVGAMQAAEALKLIMGVGASLAGRLLLLDGLHMEWSSMRVARDPGCARFAVEWSCRSESPRTNFSPYDRLCHISALYSALITHLLLSFICKTQQTIRYASAVRAASL